MPPNASNPSRSDADENAKHPGPGARSVGVEAHLLIDLPAGADASISTRRLCRASRRRLSADGDGPNTLDTWPSRASSPPACTLLPAHWQGARRGGATISLRDGAALLRAYLRRHR